VDVHKPLGSIRGLKEYCTVHRDSILVHRLASEQDVAAWWPGGANNPNQDLSAWIRCFANYVAFLDRDSDARKHQTSAARQKVILEALADAPEVVTLADAHDDGTPRTLTVFPKGFVTLTEIHCRNLVLAQMCDDVERQKAAGGPEAVELIVRVWREQTYLQRVIVWIATTPGPGLPFPELTARPEPPAELANLHSADLLLVDAAFQRVNVQRLALLDRTNSGAGRPDWSVFFASLAGAMNRPAAELMRDMSLPGLIAAASERARGHEDARVAAERKVARQKKRA